VPPKASAAPPLTSPPPPPAAVVPRVPSAPSAPAAPALARPPAFAPAAATGNVKFTGDHFAVGGLAYDAVSNRFVLADRDGRKLVIVSEGSNHAVDLVRGDAAGFQDISAVEIDSRRGDLWVASATGSDGSGTLHRLQLVSGRQLKTFRAAPDPDPVGLVDLAVTPAGVVLVLDAAGHRLLSLRPGAASLDRVMRLDVDGLVSVAAADEGIAYVAHRDGISRLDLRARTVSRVAAPKNVSLANLERIRWRRNGLIAVQPDPDGWRRVVRFDLNGAGTAVRQATTLEASVPTADRAFVTMSGDELVYLVAARPPGAGDTPRDPSSGPTDYSVFRVRVR
jgi:hypothetical protein